MIKIIINGCNGRMGKVLTQIISNDDDMDVVAGIDTNVEISEDFPVFSAPEKCDVAADVVIDFSHFSAVPALIDYCTAKKLPMVIATTALEESTVKKIKDASESIPIFHSSNMSLGINLLAKAIRDIAPSVDGDFNAEIVEKHHNKKLDAPSGTAILLADNIKASSKRDKDYIYGRHSKRDEFNPDNIAIHAIRGGTIPGEHTVMFIGPDEIIELKHIALSRDIFGHGAIKAAKYIVNQPVGLYNMDDMLG